MDLSGDAIVKITDLTERARDAELYQFQKDGTRIRITNATDGSVKWIDSLVPSIKATALTIDDLIAVLKVHEQAESIWVNSQSIIGFIGEHRDGVVKLTLNSNPAFGVLGNLRDLEPKSMIRKLRVDLFQCSFNEDLKASLAYLKFETNATSESTTVKNDVSIAKSVRSKVTNETDIPDEVTLTFQAFPNLSEEISTAISVSCAVIVEPDKGTVSVIPYPGQIDAAVNTAVQRVAEYVRTFSSGIPVFCGSCSV